MKKLISIPEEYNSKLKKTAEKLGISQSELIRRAIDDYLLKIGLSVTGSEEKIRKR